MLIKEVMQVLGKSYATVRRWADKGRIRTTKLENGHIMYWDEDVWAMVGKKISKESLVTLYTRVAGTTESDRRLMAEQQRILHAWCSARGLVVDRIYEDWAPSTEYSLEERPGLHLLLQDIIQRRVAAVVIETPDRIARLGREIIEQICRYYGVQLVYVNKVIQRPEYLAEQEADIVRLLKKAKIDRLEEVGVETLPKPSKPKLKDPGKIVPNWEGAPLPKNSRDLSDLM
jgi:predicted site-specific integrase-resolvase